jgi:hypothetical protein
MSINSVKGGLTPPSFEPNAGASGSGTSGIKGKSSIEFLDLPERVPGAGAGTAPSPRASLSVSVHSSLRLDLKNLKAALDPFEGVVDLNLTQEAGRAMLAALPTVPLNANVDLRHHATLLRNYLNDIVELSAAAKRTAQLAPPEPTAAGASPAEPTGSELGARLNLQQRVDLGYGLRNDFDKASQAANTISNFAPSAEKEFYRNLSAYFTQLKRIHLTHVAPDDREVAANHELAQLDLAHVREGGTSDVAHGTAHSEQLMAYGRSGDGVYIGTDPKAAVMNQLADEANTRKEKVLSRSAGPKSRELRKGWESLKGGIKAVAGSSYVPASGAPTHLNDSKLSAGYNTTQLHLIAHALDGVATVAGKGKGKVGDTPDAGATPWTDLTRTYYPSPALVAKEARRAGSHLPKESPIDRSAPTMLGMPDARVRTREKLRQAEFTLGTVDPATVPKPVKGAKLSSRMEKSPPSVHGPVTAHEVLDLGLVKDPVHAFKLVGQWDKTLRDHPATAQLQQYAVVKERLGGHRALRAEKHDFYGPNVPRQFQETIASASAEKLQLAANECRRIGDLAANFAVEGEKVAAAPDKTTPPSILPQLEATRAEAFANINKEIWLAEYDGAGKVLCGGYPGGQEAALADPQAFLAESHNALSLALGLAGQYISINKRELVNDGRQSARHAMTEADIVYHDAREHLDKTFLPMRKEQLIEGHAAVVSQLTVDRAGRPAPELNGPPVAKLAMQHGTFIEATTDARDRLRAYRAGTGDTTPVTFADAVKAALRGDTGAGIPANEALAERYFGSADTISGVLEKYLDFAHARQGDALPADGAPLPNEFFRFFGQDPFKRAREVSAEAAHHAPGSSVGGTDPFDLPPPLEKIEGFHLGEGPSFDAASKEWQDLKAAVQAQPTPDARAQWFTENPHGQRMLQGFSVIMDNLRQTLSATMHHTDDGAGSRPASFSVSVREKPEPPAGARPGMTRSRTSISLDIPAIFASGPLIDTLPGDAVSTATDKVSEALRTTAATPNAKVLVMGYSPTGGGHTGRTLDIVQQALAEGTIGTHSTVILHVPSKWNNQARPSALDALAQAAKAKGVTLVVCGEADKSVQGYLKDSGASDDAKILGRFAQLPNRLEPMVSTVGELKIYEKAGDLVDLPSITAEDLMKSVHQTLGAAVVATKLRVLTDMDPALQKAAARYGVPGKQRVDQQNHAILLDMDNQNANIDPKFAVLAKVLSGYQEMVSHIGLGDKNTLLSMTPAAQALGITRDTTKAEARTKVAAHFLKYGREAHIAAASKQTEGILKHADVKDAGDVKNIVYVYAHKNQDPIANLVREELEKGEEADDAFKNTLFVFCGKAEVFDKDAVQDAGLGATGNAMHLAYLADADGITTSGAGTHGEFSYLHKAGGAKSGLLAFPIKGHNEQKANADYVAAEASTQAHVSVREDSRGQRQALAVFVKEGVERSGDKYAAGTMATMLNAIGDKSSYVQQAHDLLFGKAAPTQEALDIAKIEQAMRNSPELKANRKYLKMVFQALDQISAKAAADGNVQGSLQIALTKKQKDRGEVLQFESLKQFSDQLRDDNRLTQNLGSSVHMSAKNLLLLSDVRNFFQEVSSGLPMPTDVMNARIHELMEKLGDTYVTGF